MEIKKLSNKLCALLHENKINIISAELKEKAKINIWIPAEEFHEKKITAISYV